MYDFIQHNTGTNHIFSPCIYIGSQFVSRLNVNLIFNPLPAEAKMYF